MKNVIFPSDYRRKSVLYIGLYPRKMYLCKKQVNNSYFKGIDETEDYTTVETLER